MSKIVVNDITLHYWQVGEGPPVILIHGFGGNLELWHLKLVPTLRQKYQVVTYDLRGHGRSDQPPSGYTTRDMADDLMGLMDALNIEHAHMVGHSLGADIALHTALIAPERVDKMVLIEAGIPALLNLRKGLDWGGWHYWADMIEKFSGVKIPEDKRNDVAYMFKMSAEVPIVFGPAKGLRRKNEKIDHLINDTTVVSDYEVVGELTLENLATIPHPKILIYDEGSPYLGSYKVLKDILINCQPVVLPQGEYGHFGPLEEPELLLEYVEPFLNGSNGQL
jgi:pimeloyl-ACP methyl ester carboxylesterase